MIGFRRSRLAHPDDRGPLRVMFVITSMPVGGAETLLVNLVRRMDRSRFAPELCCLKQFGPLGEVLAQEIPAFTGLLSHKYDVAVLPRLTQLMRARRIDAVVTVGTGGDKMFWGRLAAWRAGVPVILSALHSTGLPDRVEQMNRLLTPLTDGFIGCAVPHGKYLAEHEGCPASRVFVIPNGVDTGRFRPLPANETLRASLGLSAEEPVATIVAALRPEKNHELFLNIAAQVHRRLPEARFLVIGDGPRRGELEALSRQLCLDSAVRFLGTRADVPELLALSDTLVLTSHMEANPVSILEAMACGKPVIATQVGSIPETVRHGVNGLMAPAGDLDGLADHVYALLSDRKRAAQMGHQGRSVVVDHWSLDRMVAGYQNLIRDVYLAKCRMPKTRPAAASKAVVPAGW
ncbi:MAG: glycosyltransferase [Planctomycetes bacterium]|nr:glycosyltransferase [Planctomycetota bacterium]